MSSQPPIQKLESNPFIRSFANLNDKLIIVLDAKKMLNQKEMTEGSQVAKDFTEED